MSSNYSNMIQRITDDDFPNGVCPLMSRMNLALAPVGGVIAGGRNEVQQTIVFTPAPCVGRLCSIWSDGSNCCGLKLST